jgi:osmotically-inducible protein OsmY
VEDNIKFSVENGEVTLEGKTSDLWAKHEIEERFSKVMGVISVDNNIIVVE